MRTPLLSMVLICTMAAGLAHAWIDLGENTTVVFATIEEAKQILSIRDEFVQRMSPFDRSARMKTDRNISEKRYLEFVGNNALAWSNAEKQRVTSAFQGVRTELAELSLPLPKKVFMVKMTGKEEGGAAYTRANAIVFPEADLSGPVAKIQKTICHELFHILSRKNPELREKLYATIGFVKCDEVEFPKELKSRKITNPDAPKNNHCIRLQVEGKAHWAIPILFSRAEKYDVTRGGEFFNYLQFQFLLVDRKDNSPTVKPIYDGGKPKLVGVQQVSGFIEQVGKNTGYLIHPEEILADNFALLVLGKRNLPSPEIVRKLRKILEEHEDVEPSTEGDGPEPAP